MKRILINLHKALTVICCLALMVACSDDDMPVTPEPQQHTEAVNELIRLLDGNAETKRLLEKSITRAAEVNPDRRYNPAQTLTEFYDFVDWNIRQLPWDVMIHQAPSSRWKNWRGAVTTTPRWSLWSRLPHG